MTHNANAKTIAIEFAEYMAKSAERYIEAVNSLDSTNRDLGEFLSIEDAEMEWTEAMNRLRSDIYEFRKRRDRANA